MSNHPDWKSQLQALLDAHNHRHARYAKDVAHRTREARAQALFQTFRLLRALGFQLAPAALNGRHCQHLFWYWTADARIAARCAEQGVAMLPRPYSAAYLQFLASTLATFARWIGKPGLVMPPAHYGVAPALFARTYTAATDKGWSGAGVDIAAVIAHVAQRDPRVAMMLELSWRMGLRRKEAIMFQPHLAVVPATALPLDAPVAREYVACISIVRGTKGGRLRCIPLVTEQQCETIARAKQFAPFRTSYLGHPGKSLRQVLDRYKNVLRHAGITKAGLGIVGHGLRHEFAGDTYFDLAEVACPVRGGDPLADPQLTERVLLAVAQRLGHGRPGISQAYVGATTRAPSAS